MTLMRLYRLVGRLSSPFWQVGFFVHNHLFHVPRARVLVWNENDELLLVRNWSGKQQWGLPGGGVEKNESSAAAAKRELYEETGIVLPLTDFSYVATVYYKYEAPIYVVRITSDVLPQKPHNPWEIIAMQWFALDNLPKNISRLVSLSLEKLSKSA